jgi:hypothetical protein
MGAQVKELESWDELPPVLHELREVNRHSVAPLLFRGQEDADWSLQTTLERAAPMIKDVADYYRLISRLRHEIESFSDSKWEIPEFVEVSKKCESFDGLGLDLTAGRFPASEYAGFLRHHGFPSPLLDWTRSPYVAAFFAFLAPGNARRAIYVFADSPANVKGRGSGQSEIFNLGSRVGAHRRHFLQQSAYTVCVKFDQGLWRFGSYQEVFESERPPRAFHHPSGDAIAQDVLWKLTLPARERSRVLRLLDEHNLNAFSLFGSTESLMATIAAREIALMRVAGVLNPQ